MALKKAEEFFEITQAETGMTGAAGLANIWSDNFRYQVPVDRKYIFRPGHTFSASFNNGTGAPAADPAANPPKPIGDYVDVDDLVRIQLRTPGEEQRILILLRHIYGQVRHFADRDLLARLDINEPVEALPGYWIVIETVGVALALAPADVDTYFKLTCDIVRRSIL